MQLPGKYSQFEVGCPNNFVSSWPVPVAPENPTFLLCELFHINCIVFITTLCPYSERNMNSLSDINDDIYLKEKNLIASVR